MNNKKKKTKRKSSYQSGGFLDFVQGAAPLLNLAVPGLGTGVGMAAGMANQHEQNKEQLNPSSYQPLTPASNKYGFQMGGPLDPPYSGKGGATQRSYTGKQTSLDRGIKSMGQAIKDSYNSIMGPTDNTDYDALLRQSEQNYIQAKAKQGMVELDFMNRFPQDELSNTFRQNYTPIQTNPIDSNAPYQIKTRLAQGGRLDSIGGDSVEVNANNPSATDSVELPQAFVDNDEIISRLEDGTKYVFPDDVINPLTGNKFSKDAKKLAQADAKIEDKSPFDKEAQMAKKHNAAQRNMYASTNEMMKMIDEGIKGLAKGGKYGYAKGGKMKYAVGGFYQGPGDPPRDSIPQINGSRGMSQASMLNDFTHIPPFDTVASIIAADPGPVKLKDSRGTGFGMDLPQPTPYGVDASSIDWLTPNTAIRGSIPTSPTLPGNNPNTNNVQPTPGQPTSNTGGQSSSAKPRQSTTSTATPNNPTNPGDVTGIQRFANAMGASLVEDGILGPKTQAAINALQQFNLFDTNMVKNRINNNAMGDPATVATLPQQRVGANVRASAMGQVAPFQVNGLPFNSLESVNPQTPQDLMQQALDSGAESQEDGTAQGDATNLDGLRTKSPLGEALQYAALAGQGAMLLGGYDKQELRLADSPINVQQFDPTQSLAAADNAYAASRRQARNTTSRSSMMGNLQSMAANQAQGQAGIVDRYNQMNKQAQTQYEGRLAQREAQNLQRRYAVDQIRQQDQAGYRRGITAFLGSVNNLGQSKVAQAENQKSVEFVMQAYPDIAKYFLQQMNGQTNNTQ